MTTNTFKLEFEAEVFEKSDAAEGRERRIGGIVSTDHLDRQQEVLLQEGLDFRPFLKSGYFNDNHAPETESVLGFPESIELRRIKGGKRGWYVEGYLLKTSRANGVWEVANELKRSNSGRTLGSSDEGAILDRDPADPSTVRKALVREIAITKCPVNDNTSMQLLAKSLSAGYAGSGGNSGVPGSAAPISRESLEGVSDEDEKKKKKRLTKAEAVAYLRTRNPLLSDAMIQSVVAHAIKWHSAT